MAGKNEQKVVTYFLANKNIIKFDGDDEIYPLAPRVIEVSDFDKYPILKGDTVEVGLKDGEVSFLKKVGGGKKSSSSASTTKTSSNNDGEKKTLTVEAIYKNESIKFKEEKIAGKAWCPVSDELKTKDLKSIGFIAKNEVTVTIADNVIVAIDGVVEPETKTSSSTPEAKQTSTYASGKNDSIERQCAMKGAVEIVKSLLESKEIDKSEVKEVISDLTKACYKAIQDA